ncbi:DUF6518 family protein [Nocardiopsis ganjiahuensis]|uniref:DUF6518 family protein n=1 Tax=Nocardiopsis ganjiahuensis TaxID=239984 RepID=UPI00034AF1DC|nr:DUF6518 family protein [Nocardiopsis ganjiahuensis]
MSTEPTVRPAGGPEEDPSRGRSPWVHLGASVGVGLLVGFLTSFAQGFLPDVLHPMANSAGSWSLVAFLLALRCPRRGFAVAVGVLSLFAMVAGYDAASVLRGFAVSLGSSLFWIVAAVAVGPFLGWGGHELGVRSRIAPLAVGAMSGVLVGEGVYGLTVIAATTPAAYWTGSVTVGLLFLLLAIVRAFPRPVPALVAVGTTALVSLAFNAVYTADLIQFFPLF